MRSMVVGRATTAFAGAVAVVIRTAARFRGGATIVETKAGRMAVVVGSAVRGRTTGSGRLTTGCGCSVTVGGKRIFAGGGGGPGGADVCDFSTTLRAKTAPVIQAGHRPFGGVFPSLRNTEGSAKRQNRDSKSSFWSHGRSSMMLQNSN